MVQLHQEALGIFQEKKQINEATTSLDIEIYVSMLAFQLNGK